MESNKKKKVKIVYIGAINDMYERASTSVRTRDGATDNFPKQYDCTKGQP